METPLPPGPPTETVPPVSAPPTPSEVAFAVGPPATGLFDQVTPGETLQRSLQKPQVPGFEILEEIGHGGMGVVFKARQIALNRIVALKMVLAGEFAQPITLQRFLTEAQAIAQIDHPGIVRVYESGSHNGLPYFALEYLPGGSLADHLQGRPQPPEQAAALVAKMAEAMQAAHEKGIIHRDLKPANILLMQKSEIQNPKSETNPKDQKSKSQTKDPAVSNLGSSDFGFVSDNGFRISDFIPKVTDFGLAKHHDSRLTATGVALGTPSYMSPEQADGRRDLGPAADVYALGAILYEMLTGRPPFLGVTPLETMMHVLRDEPVPPLHLQPQTPPDLNTICLKCLEKEPHKRYASAAALAEDLQHFLRREPILARPAGLVERATKWAKRKPAQAALVGTVLLALLALSTAVVLLLAAREQESLARQEAEANARQARQAQREAEQLFLVAQQAKEQESLARKNAEESARQAKQARLEAEENLRVAKQAVDDLFITVTATPLLKKESMGEVRKLLLEKALPLYDRLRQTRTVDQELNFDVAFHCRRAAIIQNEIGNLPKAQELYRKAVSLCQKLLETNPKDARTQAELTQNWNNLGMLSEAMGNPAEAERCYRQALEMQAKLVQIEPTVTDHQVVLGRLWDNLAILQFHTGRYAEAERSHQQALAIRTKLKEADPKNPEHRAEWAGSCANYAVLLGTLDRQKEAFHYCRQALAVRLQLVQEHPTQVEYRHVLAVTWNNLGNMQTDARQFQEAGKSYQEALRLREQLVEDYPAVLEYREDLASTWNSLGSWHMDRKEWAESKRCLEEALRGRQKLAAKHPENSSYQINLGGVLCNLGHLERDRQTYAQAPPWYTQAIAVLTPVVQKEPQNHFGRLFLRNAHRGRAMVLDKLGRSAEAVSDWERALALNNDPQAVLSLTLDLALARVRSGDPVRALVGVQEVRQRPNLSAATLFTLARILALCHATVTAPSEMREEYAGQAIGLLKQAQAKGRFKDPKRLDVLDRDPDFAALRTHSAYQAWRQGVTPGK